MSYKSEKIVLPPYDPNKRVISLPHIVILGAGASKASFPNGDKNRIQLPLMNDLIEKTRLKELLISNEIGNLDRNFEEIYDKLYNDPSKIKVLNLIKMKIIEYFSKMEIPDELTIYDKLILSLREKDLIATFNWDPLLILAYRRNLIYKCKLPKLIFLHGNVSVGICMKDKSLGYINSACKKCKEPLKAVELLYPIKDKNYDKDLYIENEWTILRNYLQRAYYVTIFGYGAPKTDAIAINIMKTVWNKNRIRKVAKIEIIDIKKEDELLITWNDFIVGHHYSTCYKFDDSDLAIFPRRTCDAYATNTLAAEPVKRNPIPANLTLYEFQKWLKPLFDEEIENHCKNTGFSLKPCI